MLHLHALLFSFFVVVPVRIPQLSVSSALMLFHTLARSSEKDEASTIAGSNFSLSRKILCFCASCRWVESINARACNPAACIGALETNKKHSLHVLYEYKIS